jgi:CBS domain-containing protein
MEVELIEIREFLAEHPPFDHLPDEVLDELPQRLAVRYLRRGTAFPGSSTEEDLWIVRKGGVEIRDSEGALLDKFGEGDLCTPVCKPSAEDEEANGITIEDSLFYLLPCDQLKALRDSNEEFDRHFSDSLGGRIRQAVNALGEGNDTSQMSAEVSQLLRRSPVIVSPETTIRDAARLMNRERVSAVLVCTGKHLQGIVTDRDLRSRCVAAGCNIENPIREIMTDRIVKIAPDTLVFEALMIMTRMNIHHIPVVGREGVAGLISNNDLIRHQSNNSLYLVGDIGKAGDLEQLEMAARRLPDLQIQLVQSGANIWHLGQAISSITDALTERLILLAQQRIGVAPISYVWLAVGSQARGEQTSRSDQDHALLLGDDYQEEEHGAYFKALAEFVSDGLARCGFYYCPGKVMATNPEWRQPYSVWRDYFDGWIRKPAKRSLMLACNFFDIRPIFGDIPLYDQLRSEVLAQTQDNRIFIAHMAANALNHKPPLGFFRNLVVIHDGEHDNTVNLKQRGIIPVVDLARIFALSGGLRELNSGDRLRAAGEAGLVSQEGMESLEDAMAFIAMLRARNQVKQLKEGREVNNYLSPDDLSKKERGHLKDAFSAIATMQSVFAQRYQTERFY